MFSCLTGWVSLGGGGWHLPLANRLRPLKILKFDMRSINGSRSTLCAIQLRLFNFFKVVFAPQCEILTETLPCSQSLVGCSIMKACLAHCACVCSNTLYQWAVECELLWSHAATKQYLTFWRQWRPSLLCLDEWWPVCTWVGGGGGEGTYKAPKYSSTTLSLHIHFLCTT